MANSRTAASLAVDPSVPTRAHIHPASSPLSGTVTAQPSKNYTTRLLLAAALSPGALVRRVADSEDARALTGALARFGATITPQPGDGPYPDARVAGFHGRPALDSPNPVNVGNAGAVLRLLLGVGAVLPEVTFVTDFAHSLGKRPNADLLDALRQLGCETDSRDGCLPITLRGRNLHGGRVEVSGARSSQFLSGLLFLAPLIGEPVEIVVTGGLVSKPPVRQTLEVLAAAGISVQASDDLLHFRVAPAEYRMPDTSVNGDWPGSAAILAAAAVTGGDIIINGLHADNQGERESLNVLGAMGSSTSLDPPAARLFGRPTRAVEFDGDRATDAVLALLGPACFVAGRSRFHNVANLRIKECDRITEPIRELRKVGVQCWEGHELGDPDPDAIIIDGKPDGYEGGIEVDGHGDHRVIMLETIVGLACRRGLTIAGAEHIAKSYPRFFADLAALGADIKLEAC